jgi:TRAP-type C4-dicarboxylate transport system substrate-binding protein
LKKKLILGLMALTLCALPFCTACEDTSTVYSLTLNDHNPAGTGPAKAMDDWAAWVEQESEGRLELEIIHGAALFTGDEIYGQLESAGCDIGHYAVDREDGFLLNLVLTLPFLGWPEQHFEDAFWTLMDEFPEFAEEWEGVTVISVMIMPGTAFHTVDTVIEEPADIVGVKMFCAEATLVNIVEAVGGTGVELPITDMAPSVQTGVVDGVFNHFPVCMVFGALEMLHCHTVFGAGVNNTPMFLLMSTEVLESLPGSLQDLLTSDESRDVWYNAFSGYDSADIAAAQAICEANNDTFINLTAAEIAEWRAVIQDEVINSWIDDCEDAGLPGQEVYDRVMELIAEMS